MPASHVRRFFSVLAFATACLAVPCARANAPLAVPIARAYTPEPLRVLSWNAWGLPAVSTNLQARMTALPDAIAKLDADVVLLQEIWAESDGLSIKRGLERHGYQYTSHLAHTQYGMTGLFVGSKL